MITSASTPNEKISLCWSLYLKIETKFVAASKTKLDYKQQIRNSLCCWNVVYIKQHVQNLFFYIKDYQFYLEITEICLLETFFKLQIADTQISSFPFCQLELKHLLTLQYISLSAVSLTRSLSIKIMLSEIKSQFPTIVFSTIECL